MDIRIRSADELELYEEVGRGGFGVVYRGIIKGNGQEVAVKQIDLENENADLFEVNKEISILSECRNPHITRYIGSLVKDFQLWVIMEYVDGGSLFDLLKPGPIADEKIISLMIKEVLLALKYLHEQGKIHRDLKSQNILVNSNGQIKLTDFGVSTQVSSNFSRRNTTVGTPYWMAPEVILNDNGGHSFKADIWSLGCCAFELFTGKPPLQSQVPPMKALRQISRCARDEDFIKLIELKSLNISDYFKDFLSCCFVVDPKFRSSAKQLLKHKFITKITESESEKEILLKKIITNKHLWDQKQNIFKEKIFYVPTEIRFNQERWEKGKRTPAPQVEFDFGTINGSPSSVSEEVLRDEKPQNPLQAQNKQQSSHDEIAPPRAEGIARIIEPELKKVLNKVFHKIDHKSNLTTEQYDSLVGLNECMMKLVVPTRTRESNSSRKILLCQFLKCFIKEIVKPVNEKSDHEARNLLQKIIVPSTVTIAEPAVNNASDIFTLSNSKKVFSPFDEIEKSLMETWIDKMTSTK